MRRKTNNFLTVYKLKRAVKTALFYTKPFETLNLKKIQSPSFTI